MIDCKYNTYSIVHMFRNLAGNKQVVVSICIIMVLEGVCKLVK